MRKIYILCRDLRNRLRTFFWRQLFGKVGHSTKIAGRMVVYGAQRIFVGDHCTITEAVLDAKAPITIGDYVHISAGAIISTAGLRYQEVMEKRVHIDSPVTIEDGVWIGSGAIINPGVRIGKNSVIGAGAVVTSDIPENVVAVGVPAKVLKRIGD